MSPLLARQVVEGNQRPSTGKALCILSPVHIKPIPGKLHQRRRNKPHHFQVIEHGGSGRTKREEIIAEWERLGEDQAGRALISQFCSSFIQPFQGFYFCNPQQKNNLADPDLFQDVTMTREPVVFRCLVIPHHTSGERSPSRHAASSLQGMGLICMRFRILTWIYEYENRKFCRCG